MTIALPKTQSINGKRIIGGFTLAVSAGVLAVAAIVTSGVLADSDQGALTASSPPMSSDFVYLPPAVDYPAVTYILVSSVEQHDKVMAEETEFARAEDLAGRGDYWFTVLLAGTPELETEAWQFIDEKLEHRPSVRRDVVDLRSQ